MHHVKPKFTHNILKVFHLLVAHQKNIALRGCQLVIPESAYEYIQGHQLGMLKVAAM